MKTTDNIFKNKKLKLKYPCEWKYTLITKDSINLSDDLHHLLDKKFNKKYTLKKSNTSKNKKFISYIVSISVASDMQRKDFWEHLKKIQNVSMVL
jgi:putative lipoic acid-binding regulatory protein